MSLFVLDTVVELNQFWLLSFTYNCLMARRLVERGVRFMQCFHAGRDYHRSLSV